MRSMRASLCIGFPPEGKSGESDSRPLIWRISGHDGRTLLREAKSSSGPRLETRSWPLTKDSELASS